MLTDLTGASLNSWHISETDNVQHERLLRARSPELNFISLLNKRSGFFFPPHALSPVPKRRDVALSILSTPKAHYVLPSRQLCPGYTATSERDADQLQSVCKALRCKYNLRLLLFSWGCAQPERLQTVSRPSSAFTWFHWAAPHIPVPEWLWCTEWTRHWETVFRINRDVESMSCMVFKLWKC